MAPLIEINKDGLTAACEQYHLKYLYVFGSAARDFGFSEKSDIDFLYAFNKEEISKNKYAENFFGFLFCLEKLFDRKIDLVPGEKIKNPFFLKEVNGEKIQLYGTRNKQIPA